MLIRRLLFALLAVSVLGPWAARAQDPSIDRVDTYRFLPRLSVVTESSPFFPATQFFHALGTFDFAIEPGPTDVEPPLHTASFKNVDAWGVDPNRNYAVNIEEAFNLEELVGRQAA